MLKAYLPYAQRYVLARLRPDGVNTEFTDFILLEPVNGVDRVRVNREHSLNGEVSDYADLQRGQSCKLFLYDLQAGGDHWFGSAIWANELVNPWHGSHPFHPAIGQVIQGSVIGHAKPGSGIIRLDGLSGAAGLLEAFLDRNEVPGFHSKSTIETLFPLGMQVEAEVIAVDHLRCKLDLSVKKWVERRKLMAQHRQSVSPTVVHHPQTDHLCLIDEGAGALSSRRSSDQSNTARPWQFHRILLVDDDEDFLRMLKAWFEKLGAKVWIASNFQHMSQLLDSEAKDCTHMLVDYGLGGRVTLKEALQSLHDSRDKYRVALMTGAADSEAKQFSKRVSLPLLDKPLSIGRVHAWLEGDGELQPNETTVGPEWSISGPLIPWPVRVENWLKALCEAQLGIGALWIRVYMSVKGVASFKVQSTWGMDTIDAIQSASGSVWDVFESRLAQRSVVSRALTSYKEQSAHKLESGSLAALFPPASTWVHAAFLSEEAGKDTNSQPNNAPQDLLLLFSTDSHGPAQRADWLVFKAWWQDLNSLRQLQQHAQAESTFASLGRVHIATQHELLALMQPFTAHSRWSAEEAVAWWPQGVKAAHFVAGGLYQIKPERENKVNLRERLSTLALDFLWQLVAKRKIRVEIYLPRDHSLINLPPEVIEQPLINLIDNATKAMASSGRAWGSVRVGVDIDVHAVLPLVVWVEDDAMGLTPEVARNCFEPRYSDSNGFGMGLYLSRALARRAGGDVVLARNLRWIGARFELRLPLNWGEMPSRNAE